MLATLLVLSSHMSLVATIHYGSETFPSSQKFPFSYSSSSVAQLCPILCDPMNRSTAGLPVHHQLRVYSNSCDTIQSSHPLSSPSLPSLNLSSIRVFSNESVLHIRLSKYWSFSFSIALPMNIQDWFPLGLTGWISLQSKGLSRIFNTTVQKHQFFSTQLSL